MVTSSTPKKRNIPKATVAGMGGIYESPFDPVLMLPFVDQSTGSRQTADASGLTTPAAFL
jgi:hypothetical protein